MSGIAEKETWDRLADLISAHIPRGQDFPAALKEEFCRRVRTYCVRWLSRQLPYEMVEDAAQEVVARTLRALPSFRGEYGGRSLLTWINTIITHEMQGFRERNARRRMWETALPDGEYGKPLRATRGVSPLEVAESKELGHRLQQALQKLPNLQRQAFQLHHLGGQPFRIVAEMLGISEASAKMAASRATRNMQHVLDKYVTSRATTGF